MRDVPAREKMEKMEIAKIGGFRGDERPRHHLRRGRYPGQMSVTNSDFRACQPTSLTKPSPMSYRSPMIDRITFNPGQCGGRPCIRGMRIRVKDVLDMLAAGVPQAEILEDYPYLEPEDIMACLEYAAAATDHPILVAR